MARLEILHHHCVARVYLALTMASSSKVTHRRLIKKYNIYFDPPLAIPFQHPTSWSETRRSIVNHIQSLGKEQYADYHESIHCDSLHRPWREQVLRRAKHTAQLANRCLADRKNEPGWRFTVEVEVMARMSVEVAW